MLLQASGYPIEEAEGGYRYRPYFTPYDAETYCVIDIETNTVVDTIFAGPIPSSVTVQP